MVHNFWKIETTGSNFVSKQRTKQQSQELESTFYILYLLEFSKMEMGNEVT